jgi:AcrR family transcriptional regulator
MQREASSTRERLIEGARHLFWERGYGAASLADILNRAAANSGSFYHFFDSKEALLRAVLETYLDGLEPVIMAPARGAVDDPIDRIFAVLAGYRSRLMDTNGTYGCPLGRLALEVDAENRPTHDLIAQNFAAWRDAIRGFLDEARDRLPPDLDSEGLAILVLTVMEGGVMQARAAGSPELFDRSVAQLRDYFRRLLGPTPSSSSAALTPRSRRTTPNPRRTAR